GERLRAWLGLAREVFYDPRRVALIGVGLCYPGRLPQGGDAPPRPECAPLWHPPLRAALPDIRLTLLVGSYAQAYYLGKRRKASLSETVRAFREYLPDFIPTPHPSWRRSSRSASRRLSAASRALAQVVLRARAPPGNEDALQASLRAGPCPRRSGRNDDRSRGSAHGAPAETGPRRSPTNNRGWGGGRGRSCRGRAACRRRSCG